MTALILSLTAICISSFVIYVNYKNGRYNFILRRFKMKNKEVKDELITPNSALIDSKSLGGSVNDIIGQYDHDMGNQHQRSAVIGGQSPTPKENLVTLEDHNKKKQEEFNQKNDEARGYEWNGIECPKCGNELLDVKLTGYSILPPYQSNPLLMPVTRPQSKAVFCRSCDFTGERFL